MPSVVTGSRGTGPQPEFVTITREVKLWARGILQTMDAAVADTSELHDGLMVFLGSVAFGSLGARMAASRWNHYTAVMDGLGILRSDV